MEKAKETKQTKEQREMREKIELQGKEWDELMLDQKIERMREVVKQQNSVINNTLDRLDWIVNKLEKHSHKKSGEIVVPLQKRGFGGSEIMAANTKSSEKVYF